MADIKSTKTAPYTRVTELDLTLDRREAEALISHITDHMHLIPFGRDRVLRGVRDRLHDGLADRPAPLVHTEPDDEKPRLMK